MIGRTINRFVILSLCMHGALLTVLHLQTPKIPAIERSLTIDLTINNTGSQNTPAAHETPRPQRLAVTANRSEQLGHVTTARSKSTSRARVTHSERPPAVVETRLPPVDAPTSQTDPASGPRQPSSDTQNAVAALVPPGEVEAATRAHIQARLMQALRANFSYPLLARRNGWQGLVKIQLRIEPDGHLSHIELIRSSGFAVLDQAAIDSTSRIQPVSEAAAWLHNTSLDVLLPVEYRLVDG